MNSVKLATMDVHLVTQTRINDDNLKYFLADIHCEEDTVSPCEFEGDRIPEIAGRVCYMSYGRGRSNADYLANIKESGHWSVIEHAVFGVIVTGVSRSLTHELVRHRIASYSQLSQRYVDESDTEFILPEILRTDLELAGIAIDAFRQAQNAYTQLVEKLSEKLPEVDKDGNPIPKTERRKMVRQAARCVLPNATETKIYITMNARSWRHFFKLRASRHAEPEIRALAIKIFDKLVIAAPNIFGDFTKVDLPDGTVALSSPCAE